MAIVRMVMPKMGESIMEGTILKWLKKPEDKIAQDEPVLEVATDKVDTEVPATHGGILKAILAQEGEVVPVGNAIAIIETMEEGATSAELEAPSAPANPAAAPVAAQPVAASPVAASPSGNGLMEQAVAGRFYSPLVMNMAREENISMAELERIPGTGLEGRVTKKDMLAYVESRKNAPAQVAATVASPTAAPAPAPTPAPQPVSAPAPEQVKPAVSFSGNAEIVEMDRMRKLIAERMVESKRTSPHVTSFVEADVTNVVNWRNKIKKEFQQRENDTITFTDRKSVV